MMRGVLGLIAGVIIILSSLTNAGSNIWLSATGNGFFVPGESNILSFEVTKMNEGSGEWWLYAKDGNFYYAITEDGNPEYYTYPAGKEPPGFDSLNLETWDKALLAPGQRK